MKLEKQIGAIEGAQVACVPPHDQDSGMVLLDHYFGNGQDVIVVNQTHALFGYRPEEARRLAAFLTEAADHAEQGATP